MSGLTDRVIVVTGAGGGLGREYALLCAAAGAKVVVNDLGGARDGSGSDTAMADLVVDEIRTAGGDAVANHDSVATEDGAAAIVSTALDTFGAIHGIVNNAGILRDATFHKTTSNAWDAVLKVHLYGAYHVTRAAWPHFREQGHGRVVMATSTSGLFGNFGQASYAAAKSGLVGLVNTLAIEGRKHGILANAIAPMAATRMTAGIGSAELLDTLLPAFVAPVVGHLLSDACTDTGVVLIAGGGKIYRVQLFQGEGVAFKQTPSLKEVAQHWPEIMDMNTCVPGAIPDVVSTNVPP